MRSLIIGIARTGSPNNFVLNPDNRYISMCGSKPEVSFSINCGQDKFIEAVNGLRYNDADPSSSADAISFFQDLITQIFLDIKYLDIDEKDLTPLHIRLVTTPFELAQLPFEFVLGPPKIAGGPKESLLANPERKITFTREVRQESEIRYNWPSKPRILFAWAQPGGEKMSVPHTEHLAVLKDMVIPKAKPRKDIHNPTPFFEELLTELPDASIEAIKKKLEEGIKEERHYTHLHILAHGGMKTPFNVADFQLILCKDGTTDTPQKIDGKTLAKAAVPDLPAFTPTFVSLSVCDSGHVGNTILPAGSLVYQLHNAGIPCVFASQFPLTQQGSVTLVKTLYQQLINACDPRVALYNTRMALKKEPTHDWASLVTYARFPEDINEQLEDAQLNAAFSSMRTTNCWVDHVFKFWNEIKEEDKESALHELESRLTTSIMDLSAFLNPNNSKESTLANELLQAEHLGLLGSAYKRQAEYFFRLIEFNPKRKSELIDQSRKALLNAKEFYSFGQDANPTSHWNSMQYLSLKSVSEGSLKDENELWYVTKRMAERDLKKASGVKESIWAWGTLAELYLLEPLIHSDKAMEERINISQTISKEYMQKMADADAQFNYAKESTSRQFERYIKWWPDLFVSNYPDWLKDKATQVRNILPDLDKLIPIN